MEVPGNNVTMLLRHVAHNGISTNRAKKNSIGSNSLKPDILRCTPEAKSLPVRLVCEINANAFQLSNGVDEMSHVSPEENI